MGFLRTASNESRAFRGKEFKNQAPQTCNKRTTLEGFFPVSFPHLSILATDLLFGSRSTTGLVPLFCRLPLHRRPPHCSLFLPFQCPFVPFFFSASST